VPEATNVTPAEYLIQQKVPWFGGGFSIAYCSPKPSTKIWGFAGNGCQTPLNPSFATDLSHSPYSYVSKKTGKTHPTLATISNDNAAGKAIARTRGIADTKAGFDLVSANPILPETVSDFTPYAAKLMTANKGKQPDAVDCLGVTQCLPLWSLMQTQGFKGIFWSGLYQEPLVKALGGAYAIANYADFTSTGPGITQMRKDLNAYQAGAGDKLDFGVVMGYSAADLFIAALQKAAAKGKSGITPENVRNAASTIQWSIPGFMKSSYPDATVMTYPVCTSFNTSNGTAWSAVESWTCSTKKYPIKGSG
jgi:hypothetical protein